ncbi:MAG: UbiD family decarboxylase [Pseudomonadota bacterium]|nr:UbiD family decarboxylase [Pseudomonadota bacterium]
MSDSNKNKLSSNSQTSRRNFIAGTSLAAVSAPFYSFAADNNCNDAAEIVDRISAAPQAPFDSIRDYMAALDARGLVMTIPEVNQDKYEMTALMFRATDEFGFFESPAFFYEKVKQDGEVRIGSMVGNYQGHVDTDCIALGLEPDPEDIKISYRRAKDHFNKLLDSGNGKWPEIAPLELSRDESPCKEITLTGDECDLNSFAFVKTNPADGGRYVNTGSVFTSDPVLGNNFGTYRCQITGPRTLRINSEKNHAGYKMLKAARERGEKVGHVAIAVGQDPIIWLLSGAPLSRTGKYSDPVDELAIAGGFRGKALKVVKADNSDMLVPAYSEMIIEGEVPLDEPMQPEGPFGEMFGYLGAEKEDVFWMNVTRITHRNNPWLMNSFTGMHRGYMTASVETLYERLVRRQIPNLVEFHYPQDMMGVAFVSIDKTAPGQGLEAGRIIANRVRICKVVVVVDKDMDVLDNTQMLFTMGSRWQPDPAHEIISGGVGNITDPSTITSEVTSKIVIDATMQWPEEGGPPRPYGKRNRTLLEELAPDALPNVDNLYGDKLKAWGKAYRV